MIRTRPLRVIHWYWQSGVGGINRVVMDLVRAQRTDPTLEVKCVVGRRHEQHERPEDRAVGIETLDFRHGFDFGRYRRVRDALAWADVVHMHVYNPVVGRAARALRKPIVYTDHGTDQHKSLRNLIVTFQLQRRFVRSRASLLTVNSRYRKQLQQEFYDVDDERIRVVHNGLDFDAIRTEAAPEELRASLGIPSGVPIIGTVAVFAVRKRIELMLEVCARISPAAHLLIVGDGPNRPDLERRAEALGIAGRTTFTGMRQDTYDLISLMDVFVLPTKGEAFGLAAVEALALGRPAVAWADGGGVAEVIREAETGFFARDVDHAAERIGALLADPALRARMGAAGRADVRRRFSIDAMAAGIRSCYDASRRRTL